MGTTSNDFIKEYKSLLEVYDKLLANYLKNKRRTDKLANKIKLLEIKIKELK